MTTSDDLIRTIYGAFNARDIDAVLASLHPDVDWPNGMDGGRVRGREEVRAYWTRQWSLIDPHVEPQTVTVDDAGRIIVKVHQVVRDHAGVLLADRTVYHLYEIEDGLVTRMDIRQPPLQGESLV